MHTIASKRPARSRRGTVLVVTAMLVVVMTGTAFVLVSRGMASHREQSMDREQIHARYVSQAGLAQAVVNLQTGSSGNVGSEASPVIWGDSLYYVEQVNLTSELIRLRSTGYDERSGCSLELVVRQSPNTIWRFGAFGREKVHMESNARVDSYDSDLGTYASQATNGSGSGSYADSNGDIGSNGDITLDQNSKVWGDAAAGPGHSTSVLGSASVSGSTGSMGVSMTSPPLSVPTYTSYGSLIVNASTSIAPGDRTYSNLTLNANKTLTILGPANIVMTNLTLSSGSSLSIDASGGPVTLWVIDNFIMKSNSFMGATDKKPKNVRLNLLSDNVINPEVTIELDTVEFASNSKFYGMLHAGDAAVTINSNFELFGSMVARNLKLNSNARFHFDEALIGATSSGTPELQTVCWRTMPYSGP